MEVNRKIETPQLGIDAMLEAEPLLDAELELARLKRAIRNLILADQTRRWASAPSTLASSTPQSR